jgi:hypothetical protein
MNIGMLKGKRKKKRREDQNVLILATDPFSWTHWIMVKPNAFKIHPESEPQSSPSPPLHSDDAPLPRICMAMSDPESI